MDVHTNSGMPTSVRVPRSRTTPTIMSTTGANGSAPWPAGRKRRMYGTMSTWAAPAPALRIWPTSARATSAMGMAASRASNVRALARNGTLASPAPSYTRRAKFLTSCQKNSQR